MIQASRKQWIKFGIVLVLYLIFLIWLKSWLGLVVVPFIFDAYISKKIPWTWWKKSTNKTVLTVMGWVDAIVFALVAVYFVNLYFFQNYVIPSSSLEKSLLVGDYLFVSKMSYGARIPQTPLHMPLTQHTLPVFNCKSYLEWPKWDYKRVAGLGEVQLNDIVVFNFPAGDTVATGNPAEDIYRMSYAIGKQLSQPIDLASLNLEQQRDVYDYYYSVGRKYIDENPQLYGEVITRPVDRRENYVKRCVALPGDTFEISQAHYKVRGCNMPLGNVDSQDGLRRIIENGRERDWGIVMSGYPYNELVNWDIMNFGPLYLPAKGDEVEMNPEHAAFYKNAIEWEQRKKLFLRGDTVLLNDSVIYAYRFKEDYYFVTGDKVMNSQDSRYWGLLPEPLIVGKAVRIWKSVDREKDRIRWDRIWKRIE